MNITTHRKVCTGKFMRRSLFFFWELHDRGDTIFLYLVLQSIPHMVPSQQLNVLMHTLGSLAYARACCYLEDLCSSGRKLA